jgi:hypothetical protein
MISCGEKRNRVRIYKHGLPESRKAPSSLSRDFKTFFFFFFADAREKFSLLLEPLPYRDTAKLRNVGICNRIFPRRSSIFYPCRIIELTNKMTSILIHGHFSTLQGEQKVRERYFKLL